MLQLFSQRDELGSGHQLWLRGGSASLDMKEEYQPLGLISRHTKEYILEDTYNIW